MPNTRIADALIVFPFLHFSTFWSKQELVSKQKARRFRWSRFWIDGHSVGPTVVIFYMKNDHFFKNFYFLSMRSYGGQT